MKYTLMILLMVVSCTPNKPVHTTYTPAEADSIVNMIDSLQVEMNKIEEK